MSKERWTKIKMEKKKMESAKKGDRGKTDEELKCVGERESQRGRIREKQMKREKERWREMEKYR